MFLSSLLRHMMAGYKNLLAAACGRGEQGKQLRFNTAADFRPM